MSALSSYFVLGQADGGEMIVMIIALMVFAFSMFAMLVLMASMWKIFTKAGQPGWAAIIPIYNLVVMLQIVGRELWWFILFLFPVLNFVAAVVLAVDLAKSFGKGIGYAAGLILLPIVFYPLLAFGSAQYVGPGGVQAYPSGMGY